MEAEARYTLVGALVLALVAALVVALMWLTGLGGRGEFDRYAIYFENQALDGLQVGAEVNVRGIKVGRVEDYALSGIKINRVRVQIRVDHRVPVRTNTVAVVTRNFVTGIAAINLVNREPAGARLVEIGAEDPLPVIAEGMSDLDEITGRVNQVGELASTALSSVNQLLSPANRDEAVATLRSVRELAAGLNQRLSVMEDALQRTGAAATSIAGAAQRMGLAGDRVAVVAESAAGQVTELSRKAGTGLDTVVAQSTETLVSVRGSLTQLTQSVARVEAQAEAATQRLAASADLIDDQLSVATTELRASLEATTRVLDRLRDPRAALLGPGAQQLGPGEVAPGPALQLQWGSGSRPASTGSDNSKGSAR